MRPLLRCDFTHTQNRASGIFRRLSRGASRSSGHISFPNAKTLRSAPTVGVDANRALSPRESAATGVKAVTAEKQRRRRVYDFAGWTLINDFDDRMCLALATFCDFTWFEPTVVVWWR